MANNMVSICPQKLKCNELIYLSTLLCESLANLEYYLVSMFPNNSEVKYLLSVKNKWIAKYKLL